MSLVSGPGRGGSSNMSADMKLVSDQHVKYIQQLDSVRDFR